MSDRDRFFRANTVRADLPSVAVRSGFAVLGSRLGQVVLQVGSVAVLARLLTPGDFGIIAMAIPISLLANTIMIAALQTAIIHREHLSHEQASAIFRYGAWINLAIAGAMALAAPLLAFMYDEPRVAAVTLVWSVVVYLASLAVVPEALLKRQMRFGAITGAQLGGMAVGAALAIPAAMSGARHWALMLQIAAMALVRASAIAAICGWRPSLWPARDDGGEGDLAALRRYWVGLSGFRVVQWAGDQFDVVIVGVAGGPVVLGLYDAARRWAWYPFRELGMSFSDVAVATFSQLQRDTGAYRRYVRRALTVVLAMLLPATAFLFVEARDFVLALLGEPWLDAVPLVQLMSAAAFVGGVGRLTPWLYLSRGETDRQLRWALIQTVTLFVSMLVGVRWGGIGVATGFAVATWALTIPGLAFAVRNSPVTLGDILAAMARPMGASLVAAGVVAAARPVAAFASWAPVRLVVSGGIFAGAYAVCWVLTPGGRATIRESLAAVRDSRPGKRGSIAPQEVTSRRSPFDSPGAV